MTACGGAVLSAAHPASAEQRRQHDPGSAADGGRDRDEREGLERKEAGGGSAGLHVGGKSLAQVAR